MAFESRKKQSLFKDVQLRRPSVGMLNFLKWKDFTDDDNEFLVLTNEQGETTGYLEMIMVLGKDLDFVYGQGTEGATQIINRYNNLLKTFTADFDILITQMPADSHVQQANWGRELDKIDALLPNLKNEPRKYNQTLRRRQYVMQQVHQTMFVAQNINHESYTVFIYGESVRETQRLRNQFKSAGGSAIITTPMSLDQKKFILKVLSDPTSQITSKGN